MDKTNKNNKGENKMKKFTKKEIKNWMNWMNNSGATATTSKRGNIILSCISEQTEQHDSQKEIINRVYLTLN